MSIPDNLNDREHNKFVESIATPGTPAVAVTNPDGTSIGGSGGTSMTDDSAFTPGASSLTPAGFLADDTASDPIDEGDVGAARMNPTTRVQYVQLKDSAGADVAVGGGTQYDEDTVHSSGDKLTMAGVVQKTADAALAADGDRAVLQVDATGYLKVNVKAGGGAGGLTDTELRAAPVPVSAAALPLPTGAATLAEQQSQTTSLQLIDDTVHAANAALGKALAVGGVMDDTATVAATEGNVSAARITAQRALHVNLRDASGTELAVGGGTQYDEDTAHASGDKVTMAGVVQQAADAALSTDGDRSLLQVDASGYLKATVKASALPTGAATEATLSLLNSTNSLLTSANTDLGPVDETAPATDTASSGLNGRLQRIAQRLTSLIALLPAALVSGRLDVNLGAAPATVTVDSELPTAAALADNTANPTVPGVGAFAMGFDGTNWDRVRADGGSLWAQGDVAHDGADANNPVKIGGKASSTVPAVISASGDRVNAFFDQHGRLHTRDGKQGVVPTQHTHVPAANTKATISKSAAGAGVRIVCTKLTVTFVSGATAPTAVQVRVDLIDGSSGGTTYLDQFNLSLPATAGATNGVVETDVWYVGTANTAMTLEFSAAGGANTLESVAMSCITITE